MISKKELFSQIGSNATRIGSLEKFSTKFSTEMEKRLDGIEKSIEQIESHLERRDETFNALPLMLSTNFVECDVCGCLLKKETAVKGKSTVEKASECKHQFETVYAVAYVDPVTEREVIKEHYYCKIHAPKKKK